MIRVAVADDSPFTCRLVAGYLEQGGECEVIGMAHDVPSTLDLVRAGRPDVLTLDLEMPGGKGLDALAQLADDTRVVVISGVTRRAAATTLRALELGAVDFVLKCSTEARVRPDCLRREIVAKVKAAASAIPRAPRGVPASGPGPARRATRAAAAARQPRPRAEVIVIGASTGGPCAVRDLLAQFPPDFETPCVVVQHLPAMFTAVFAAELARHVRVTVSEARTGARLEPGCALVVPGALHLLVRPHGRFELRRAGADDVHRPSIDLAMTSAAESYGASSLGVVLTGMGSDGSEGLRRIRERGGEGYVQDPATCVMASMPARALERAGADYVATPERIGHLLAMRRVS